MTLSLLALLLSLASPVDVALAYAADVHGVDPRLMRCVMLAESGGDANAVGAAGEIGLMQLMPATAALIAEHAGVSEYNLFAPAHNLWLAGYGLARWPEWWTTYEGCRNTEEE